MNSNQKPESDYIEIENLKKAVNAVEETLKQHGAVKEAEVQLVLHSVLTNVRQRNSEWRLANNSHFGKSEGDGNGG